MRKLSTLLAVPILLSANALAQERTITGKVTDARDGSLLPGVTVSAGSAVRLLPLRDYFR